jgi:hypothetical protein
MMRYFPPMGTAGFDRFNVNGKRRLPRPPPRITPITSCMVETLARNMPDVREHYFKKWNAESELANGSGERWRRRSRRRRHVGRQRRRSNCRCIG